MVDIQAQQPTRAEYEYAQPIKRINSSLSLIKRHVIIYLSMSCNWIDKYSKIRLVNTAKTMHNAAIGPGCFFQADEVIRKLIVEKQRQRIQSCQNVFFCPELVVDNWWMQWSDTLHPPEQIRWYKNTEWVFFNVRYDKPFSWLTQIKNIQKRSNFNFIWQT